MEKYRNEHDKECYKGVAFESAFSSDLFHEVECSMEEDKQVALHTNLGSLTVVDRMTGFSGGIRDIESGFRSLGGDFWLASGNLDVRESGAESIGEAIGWVKRNANTCIGE